MLSMILVKLEALKVASSTIGGKTLIEDKMECFIKGAEYINNNLLEFYPKVYIVHAGEFENSCSNEEFIFQARISGEILSLKEFEMKVNEDEINLNNHFIRIL